MAKLKSTEIYGTLHTQGIVTIDENIGKPALKIATELDGSNIPSSSIINVIEINRGIGNPAEIFWDESNKSWKVKDADETSGQSIKKIAVEWDTIDGGNY
jgi:hypothetical protein